MFRMSAAELEEKRPVYKTIESPVGRLILVATGLGLRGLLFERTAVRSEEAFRLLREEEDHPLLKEAEGQLREYFALRRRSFDLPLDLVGTRFQKRVWDRLLRIPYGGTAHYGGIAGALGDPRAARAVGGAVGRNPVGIMVPCHRVIGKDGHLTGFGGGLDVKTALLNLEAAGRSGSDYGHYLTSLRASRKASVPASFRSS